MDQLHNDSILSAYMEVKLQHGTKLACHKTLADAFKLYCVPGVKTLWLDDSWHRLTSQCVEAWQTDVAKGPKRGLTWVQCTPLGSPQACQRQT